MEAVLQKLTDALSKFNSNVPPPSPYKSSEIEGNLVEF